jgi:hypothetical protein
MFFDAYALTWLAVKIGGDRYRLQMGLLHGTRLQFLDS